MNGYTKLFSQIVTSTIWQEPNDCRVLWITMLALKDDKSLCPATVPYLAKACNLSIEQTEAYLEKFQNPDEYSRSQEFDGRRIEKVDGGWLILNGQKYRDALRSIERKDYIREKVREHRVNKRKQSKQGKPISDTDTKAEAKEEKPHSVATAPVAWSQEACKDWEETLGNPQGGRIGIALKPIVTKHGWENVRPAWKKYLSEKDPIYASPSDFASKFEIWRHDGKTAIPPPPTISPEEKERRLKKAEESVEKGRKALAELKEKRDAV